MDSPNWSKSEVISYLELKILEDKASDDELELYEDYKWFGKLSERNATYENLLEEMDKEYGGW